MSPSLAHRLLRLFTPQSAKIPRWVCLLWFGSALQLPGATQYYDTSATSGFPGNGNFTWNTSTAQWGNASGNATPVVWNNASLDDASLGQGSGNGNYTATLGTSITVGRILRTRGTWSIALGSNTLTFNSGTDFTFGGTGYGSISGTGGLIKTGANTLTLSGTGHSYTGATTINQGILAVSTLANIGSNSGIGRGTSTNATTNAASLVINGGTLRYTGANRSMNRLFTIGANGATLDASGASGALTFNNTGSLAAASTGNRTLTLTGANTGNNTLASVIVNPSSGATSVAKTGAGTWVLSANNTYTGSTTVSQGTLNLNGTSASTAINVNGGTLNLGANNRLANTAAVTLAGGTLGLGTFTDTVGSFTISSGTLGGSGTLTATTYALQGGTVTANLGAGALTASSGTTALNGTAAATTVNVNSGTLTLGAANRLADTAAVTIAGGTLNLGTFSDTVGAVTLSSGTIAGSGTLTGSSYALQGGTVNANLGTGTMTVTSGTTTLNGTSASTTLNLDSGTLNLGASNRLANTATVNVSGGTLGIGSYTDTIGSFNLSSGSLTGTGTLSATSAFSFSNSANVAISTNLGGTASLTKTGAGTLTLSGSNSYTGGTNLNGGTLALGSSGAIGSSGTIAFGGGTLQFSGSNTTDYSNRFSTAAGQAFNIDTNGQSVTFASALVSSGGTLTKTGGGTLTLSGSSANTYNGLTTVSAGQLSLNKTAGTNAVAGNVLIDGGTLQLLASNQIANTAAINLTSGTLGMGTFSDTVGAVTIAGGNITGSGTLTGSSFTATNTTTSTVSAALAGNAALTKSGAGTLQLSGVNTFTGGVTINSGTLLAQGTTSSGGFTALGNYSSVVSPTTVITVNSGGTLAVQNTTAGWVDPGFSPNALLNLSLSGTGADGGGALQAQGGRNTWSGNVSLAGDTRIQNTVAGDNATLFLGPYVAPSPTTFQLAGNDLEFVGVGDTYISSSILDSVSGPGAGNITLNLGTGTANVYFGGAANTYTGDTTINQGTLRLLVDPGLNPNSAILGNLTIGDGTGSAGTATAMLVLSDQIADNATVTIHRDGKLDLATSSTVETLNGVTLNGGHIATGTGALYIKGDIDVTGAFTSKIDGQLLMDNFSSPARIFNVGSGSTLELNANLFGKDYIKTGQGTMIVTANNNANGYTGLTTVSEGILNLRNSGALGGLGSGTIVADGATLQLDNTFSNITVGAEALTINGTGVGGSGALNSLDGTNSWAGAITLGSNSTINTSDGSLSLSGSIKGTAASGTQTLTIAGAGNTSISGPISNGTGGGSLGITKVDAGTLTLNGVNSFTGAINVQAGTVQVTAHNVLQAYQPANGGVGNTVNVSTGATFAVSGGSNFTTTIGAVTGTGTVSIAASTILKVANGSANTFDGTLTGPGLFDKTGSATLTFSSTANTSAFDFDGTVQVSNGTLAFQGGSASDALFIGELKTVAGTTLFLDQSFINVGTLNITGNTILDFGTNGASILNANNIYIAAGAVLTIRNWTSEIDFLFANADFRQIDGGGTLAGFNTPGSAPQNQVHFEDDPLSPDGSQTGWINYDYQGYTNWEIRPIPEPSTYGAILLSASLALLAWRKHRQRKAAAT